MKQMKTLLGLLVLLGALSCSKTRLSSDGGEGTVSFQVSSDNSLVEVTKSSVADYTTLPQATDFNLVVTEKSGNYNWSGLLSDWDPAVKIPAGNYAVEAYYGSLEEEGFDKPYFYGATEFTLAGGETKPVSVDVLLANTIVKINCNDLLKSYYKNYSFNIVRGTTEIATYAKDETKGVFLDGYQFSVSGVLTTETGAQQTVTADFKDLDPATAYTLQFDLTNVGSGTVTVSFNDTVEDYPLENIELNE